MPSTPTQLWYTRCPAPTVSGIAQHQRWLHREFARSGITFESIRASQDRAVRESHFRHSLPGSFREGGNVPPIWARAQGQETRVIGITWVDEEQLVFVHPDNPAQDISQLRGQRLGVIRKEQSDLVDVGRAESLQGLLSALRLNGVARNEVQFIDIAAPEWELREQLGKLESWQSLPVEAVLNHQVDAVFIKGANIIHALQSGLRPVFNLNRQQDPLQRLSIGTPRPITVDSQTLQEHPELVDRYLAILLHTAQWAASHPQQLAQVVAAETQLDPDTVESVYGTQLAQAFEPKLSPLYRQALALQKDFLLEEGFIAHDFNVEDWIDDAPLIRAHALKADIQLALSDE